LTGRTHNINLAAEVADDPLHNRKPQAAGREFGAEERIEDLGFYFFCHSAAGIRNLDPQVIAWG
jgi:hypothetical protein